MPQGVPRRFYSINFSAFWIILSFIVWVFMFWGFFSTKLFLTNDALSYYEHTKFFVENLAKRIIPLWDPFWTQGVSNDFFLRRIGAFNPFYSVIILLESLGLPYSLAYLYFLAGYYWGGMIAFYLLAMRLYNNRLIAYGGYLMLLFSACGMRLFDSFVMIVTVPLIWFFYFLVAFSQTPRKSFFLGICLSLTILLGTYVPFYFLTFFILFFLMILLFYFSKVFELARLYINFFNENKLLVILSLSVVLFSLAPAISFFNYSTKGQIVLPVRHWDINSSQVLTVDYNMRNWGLVEELLYSTYFMDLGQYRYIDIYVPFFACLVFVLGLFCGITRRAIFLFVCGLVLFCSMSTHGLPFYDFLYRHVFFFKYFRNLHFFLWFVLIPLFVLLVLEHWHIFRLSQFMNSQRKIWSLIYVFTIHVLAFLFIHSTGDIVINTYLMLMISLLFWSLLILGRLHVDKWGFVLLTIIILLQPLQIYSYFLKHYQLRSSYGYHFSFFSLQLKQPDLLPAEKHSSYKPSLYYASSAYNLLSQNVQNYALTKYLQNKLILVDHLWPIDRHQISFSSIEKVFLKNDNGAFIFRNNSKSLVTNSNDPHPSAQAQSISKENSNFRILSFNGNQLKFAINLPYKKFLIYNDNYDPYWKVTINGHRAELYQTNVSFKGVWLPAGKSIVEFHYGAWWQHVMNLVLLAAAFVFLFGIIWFSRSFWALKESNVVADME